MYSWLNCGQKNNSIVAQVSHLMCMLLSGAFHHEPLYLCRASLRAKTRDILRILFSELYTRNDTLFFLSLSLRFISLSCANEFSAISSAMVMKFRTFFSKFYEIDSRCLKFSWKTQPNSSGHGRDFFFQKHMDRGKKRNREMEKMSRRSMQLPRTRSDTARSSLSQRAIYRAFFFSSTLFFLHLLLSRVFLHVHTQLCEAATIFFYERIMLGNKWILQTLLEGKVLEYEGNFQTVRIVILFMFSPSSSAIMGFFFFF